jgi:hypothetical protein
MLVCVSDEVVYAERRALRLRFSLAVTGDWLVYLV